MDEITALSILTQTLEQCINDYTPAAEVFAALEFLSTRTPVKWPFVEFRQGLQSDDETRRRKYCSIRIGGYQATSQGPTSAMTTA